MHDTIRRHALRLVLPGMATALAVALSGCAQLAALRPAPAPEPCERVFSEARCEVITHAAAAGLRVSATDIVLVEILPEPTPLVQGDGTVVLQTRSGGPPLDVTVGLRDGSHTVYTIGCGGISAGFVPACMDEPRLRAESAVLGGYRDVPCGGPNGDRCATPHPPVTPDAAAAAVPIVVGAVDIPVDRVGLHEVPLGAGSLPNGILTEASFTLADPWPDGIVILDGAVYLSVRSLEPGARPFDNYYLHGWREGVERVEAVLVFRVDHVEPGAVLSVRDVVVR